MRQKRYASLRYRSRGSHGYRRRRLRSLTRNALASSARLLRAHIDRAALNYAQRSYSDDDSFFIDLDAYAARTQT